MSLARILAEDLGLPASAAVSAASSLMATQSGSISCGLGSVKLSCDLTALRLRVRASLDEAVSRSTEVRRGRPRKPRNSR